MCQRCPLTSGAAGHLSVVRPSTVSYTKRGKVRSEGRPAIAFCLAIRGLARAHWSNALRRQPGLEGATIARVQCHEVEREIPYTMVSGLLSQLVECSGASAAPPDALAELAQTIPAVRVRFPGLPTPTDSQGEAFRIRFTEAAHALIAAVSGEHAVILVVDDVHHGDDVSLAVLHRVIRLDGDAAGSDAVPRAARRPSSFAPGRSPLRQQYHSRCLAT